MRRCIWVAHASNTACTNPFVYGAILSGSSSPFRELPNTRLQFEYCKPQASASTASGVGYLGLHHCLARWDATVKVTGMLVG